MHEKPQLFALTPRAVMCAANHVLLGAPFYNNFEKLHARCSVAAASPESLHTRRQVFPLAPAVLVNTRFYCAAARIQHVVVRASLWGVWKGLDRSFFVQLVKTV